MGYIAHHAIVVTGYGDSIVAAHDQAAAIFASAEQASPVQDRFSRLVSPLIGSAANSYGSFLVAPDGSKEGWSTSGEAEAARATLIDWLRETDGVDWALVRFGGDDWDLALVEQHRGDDRRPSTT